MNPEKNASKTSQRLLALPFKKSVEISFKSLRVRFFRSLITTMSLILAISFFSFVNVSTDIANGLLESQDPQFRQALIHAGYDIEPEDTSVGSNSKQRWIIILSLLVCTVGIINAQLMAVSERFREIGTMKCLGALDRFILRLFLLEGGIQGLIGSGMGALAGAFLSLIHAVFYFGIICLKMFSWTDVILSIITAVGIGCLLSLIGVLYPAMIAARMQPVEAMRAEE